MKLVDGNGWVWKAHWNHDGSAKNSIHPSWQSAQSDDWKHLNPRTIYKWKSVDLIILTSPLSVTFTILKPLGGSSIPNRRNTPKQPTVLRHPDRYQKVVPHSSEQPDTQHTKVERGFYVPRAQEAWIPTWNILGFVRWIILGCLRKNAWGFWNEAVCF